MILIIDSINELKVLMGLPQDDFSLERYFPNSVKREKKEISIVFIKEKLEQMQLDFICDIIVELYLEIFHGRILRKLVIKKLRGEKIDFSVHLFSLSDGRFKCFVPRVMPYKKFLTFLKKYSTPQVNNNIIKTGIKALDKIINGGLRFGDVFVVEVTVYHQ